MKFSCPLIRASGVIYPKLVNRERYIFLFFLFISLLQLWLTRYVPSLDGPQHLYTSNILKQLLLNNDFFQSFFRLSDGVVGYWVAHAVLTLFNFIFPPWLAEKLFLSVYLIGMVYAFRYLVRSLNPQKGNFVEYLIFPFLFHSYFLMGYYAFSVAVIFFFLGFGYWLRNRKSFSWKNSFIFSMILFGLFLSHGFVFALFGVSFFVFLISVAIYDFVNTTTVYSRGIAMKLMKYIVAAIPAVLFWIIYMRSVLDVSSTVSEPGYSGRELVNFLLRIRQLVGFHHELESTGYVPLFILIVLLAIAFCALYIPQLYDRTKKISAIFSPKNAFVLVALTMIIFYFFAPDKISAGSLTNRFGLFFFLAMITWLSVQKFPKTLQIISLVVVLFSVTYTRYIHHRFLEQLNRDAKEIAELSDQMKPNSIVHYLQASNNWVHLHFQLYATSGKPLVNLKTTQNQGQFVTQWNYDKLPLCFAGDLEVRPAGALKRVPENGKREIDYITVFKYDDYMQDSTNADWHEILASDYELVYTSSRGNAALFQRSEIR